MKKILELREKRAKAWEAAKAFLDSKRGGDGLLSAEDTATYEKMEQEVVDLGKEIERLERQAAIDAELNKPTSEPIVNKPNNDPEGDGKKGRASDKYRRTFWNAMRRKSFYDVENALQVGTDSEGGYLVPDEFEHTLVEALEEENFFRGIATVVQTSSGDRKIPVVATKGTASWIDEEGAYPESDDSFGQVSIGAYKVATMLKVSDELLNDSVFDLEAYISKEFGRRIGTKEEEASDGVTTAAAGITFDDVMDLFYAVKSPYRKKAVWVLNDTTVKALRKLKDNNGNYIWQPSVQAGQPDMILNRPYHTSAYVPEVAAGAKVMAFGDFSYYWIADRQGRSFKRLNELFAANGQVGFLASQRVDGKLILSEAVKTMAIKGSSAGA